MNNSIETLLNFISAAEKSRKYLPNTATNYRTPLRLIEPELTDEEKSSIDSLEGNLEQIFHIVYSKNQSKYSASSIEVYKRRVQSIIKDYKNHGTDSSKMAAWDRDVVIKRAKKKNDGSNRAQKSETEGLEGNTDSVSVERYEISLIPGRKIIIITPPSLTNQEFSRVQSYVDHLKSSMVPKSGVAIDLSDESK